MITWEEIEKVSDPDVYDALQYLEGKPSVMRSFTPVGPAKRGNEHLTREDCWHLAIATLVAVAVTLSVKYFGS